jgi:hypothetical protein
MEQQISSNNDKALTIGIARLQNLIQKNLGQELRCRELLMAK